MLLENFWSRDDAKDISVKLAKYKEGLDEFKSITEKIDKNILDLKYLKDLKSEIKDDELNEMVLSIDEEIFKLKEKIDEIKISKIFKDKYSHNNAIVNIFQGAGGTESNDWTEMLFNMYIKWADEKGFKVDVLDFQKGDEVGLKSVSFLVKGENAYGYLKSEHGTHRLVRISPFDANKRRHTTFAGVEVIPEINLENDVDIDVNDLKIDTYRSGGKGGQNVNKVETAVRITHLPTNISVSCEAERSQSKNKEIAMKILKSKLLFKKEEENKEKIKELKGETIHSSWANQIRSYVMQPYSLVKDHRTNYEEGNVESVLNGNLDGFIKTYLEKEVKNNG